MFAVRRTDALINIATSKVFFDSYLCVIFISIKLEILNFSLHLRILYKYVCVTSLKNVYTLFHGLTYNMRGYFASCAVFFRAPKAYYYPPSFNFFGFWFGLRNTSYSCLNCALYRSHKEYSKDENKTKETIKLYFVTHKNICRA